MWPRPWIPPPASTTAFITARAPGMFLQGDGAALRRPAPADRHPQRFGADRYRARAGLCAGHEPGDRRLHDLQRCLRLGPRARQSALPAPVEDLYRLLRPGTGNPDGCQRTRPVRPRYQLPHHPRRRGHLHAKRPTAAASAAASRNSTNISTATIPSRPARSSPPAPASWCPTSTRCATVIWSRSRSRASACLPTRRSGCRKKRRPRRGRPRFTSLRSWDASQKLRSAQRP